LRYEIIISGLGGQGILLAGNIIGTAVAVFEGLEAVQIVAYGPEARGGRVFTEVIISDEEIDYPRVLRPDIVITMSQRAYDEFGRAVIPGGRLIYDPGLVVPEEREDVELIPIPATKMAEELGARISANMVMLGALTALCDLLKPEAVEQAISMRVRRALEVNLKAFRMGYEAGLRWLEEARR